MLSVGTAKCVGNRKDTDDVSDKQMLKLPGPYRGLRIGLFGGSFNPAHKGHMHVAKTALRRMDLDWIWWIVARGNPLKSSHGVYAERLASARKIAAHPRMRVSDIEDQLGLTYTIDTIKVLQKRAIGAEFVWIMGSDAAASLHKWKNWHEIRARIPIVVVSRPLTVPGERRPTRLTETSAHLAPMTWLYAPLDTTSSTEIRHKSTKTARKP